MADLHPVSRTYPISGDKTAVFGSACRAAVAWSLRVLCASLGCDVPTEPWSRESFDESVAYLGPGDIVEEFVTGEITKYGTETCGIEVRDSRTYWVCADSPRDYRSRELWLASYGFAGGQRLDASVTDERLRVGWSLDEPLDRASLGALEAELKNCPGLSQGAV